MIAVLCRTSKEDKPDAEGMSIPSQINNGKALAKKLYGDDAQVEIYSDPDRSGDLPPKQWLPPQTTARKPKYREGLTRLIDDIENGKIEAIIVRKLDRLTRYNTEDGLKLLRFISERNVDVHGTHENIVEMKTASGALNLTLLIAVAAFEKAKISDNIQSTLQDMKHRGLKYTGARSLGYKDGPKVAKGEGTVLIDEDEAEIVRFAYDTYLEYGTIGSVYSALKTHYPEDTKTGSKWARQTVKHILSNVNYIGKIRTKEGEIFDSVFPQLIPTEEFEKVQKMLNANAGQRSESKQTLLTGLMHCDHCGQKMYTWYEHNEYSNAKNRVYACRECESNIRPVQIIEPFWNDFAAYIAGKEILIRTGNRKLSELHIKLNTLTKTRETLIAQASEGLVTPQEFKAFLKASNSNIKKIQDELDNQSESYSKSEVSRSEWVEMTTPEKRAYLFAILESLRVSSEGAWVDFKAKVESPFFKCELSDTYQIDSKKFFFPAYKVKQSNGAWRNSLLPHGYQKIWQGWSIGTDGYPRAYWGSDLPRDCKPLRNENGMRFCSKCRKIFPESNFYKRKNGKIDSGCKECRKAAAREFKHRKKNTDTE